MKKTQESGRSMVEMLGVLAIIGVLSIGGIAGYSMAMNRYRANEILDAASKYAVVLFSGKETYEVTHGNTTSYVPTDFANIGMGTLPTGATIATPAAGNIGETVKLTITFPSDNVCLAAASMLGLAATKCDNATITDVEFKQS